MSAEQPKPNVALATPASESLARVLGLDPACPSTAQTILQLESLLGAGLTAIVGGAFGGVQGGAEIATVWAHRVVENMREKDAPARIAWTTAVTLARVNAFTNLVDGLKQQGIIQVSDGMPQDQIFDLVTGKIQRIVDASVVAMRGRKEIATAELPAIRAEAALQIAKIEIAGERAMAYPRVAITNSIVLAEKSAEQALISGSELVDKGGGAVIKTGGNLLARVTGTIISLPHSTVGWAAEALPDVAIPAAISTDAGALLGAIVALQQGYPVTTETFWLDTGTGAFLGLLVGTLGTIVASRMTKH